MFYNLLQNACEATGPGGHVEVCVECATDIVSIRIRDDGPGLAATDEEVLFEPFYTTKERGTGLGLAIARQIAVAHGGQVRIRALATRGTEAEITLPRLERLALA